MLTLFFLFVLIKKLLGSMINLPRLIGKTRGIPTNLRQSPRSICRLTLKEKVSLRWRCYTDVSQQTLRFDLVLAENVDCLEDYVSSLHEVESSKWAYFLRLPFTFAAVTSSKCFAIFPLLVDKTFFLYLQPRCFCLSLKD